MTFTSRPYGGPDDLNLILALLREAWREWRPSTHLHVGDIPWRMRDPGYADTLRLWEDAQGNLAGFAEVGKDSFELQVHPRYVNVLETEIVNWFDEHFGNARTENGQPLRIHTWANPGEAGFIALLERRGYRAEEAHYCFHRGSIVGPIAEPVLPPGYSVRHLHGAEEIEARVQVHRDGWQTTKMTVEAYRRLMAMPGYRPELDIVAVTPDGMMVACCNCWVDEENGAGYFEPVSTHAAHRQQGLGRAIILYGQRQMQRHGAHTAHVVSQHENVAARRLYESCGMAVARRDYRCARTWPSMP